jgi:hypothetical protein
MGYLMLRQKRRKPNGAILTISLQNCYQDLNEIPSKGVDLALNDNLGQKLFGLE